jgi:hypothetical protein
MKTVVLDTNILVLLVVGQTSRDYIGKHKRPKAFTVRDYDLLMSILRQASSLRFTPNTLTVACNLLSQIGEPARSDSLKKFAAIISKFDETCIESRSGTEPEEFTRLGLTESVLLLLSNNPSLILITADLGLCLAAGKRGLNALNFNHHREFNPS